MTPEEWSLVQTQRGKKIICIFVSTRGKKHSKDLHHGSPRFYWPAASIRRTALTHHNGHFALGVASTCGDKAAVRWFICIQDLLLSAGETDNGSEPLFTALTLALTTKWPECGGKWWVSLAGEVPRTGAADNIRGLIYISWGSLSSHGDTFRKLWWAVVMLGSRRAQEKT